MWSFDELQNFGTGGKECLRYILEKGKLDFSLCSNASPIFKWNMLDVSQNFNKQLHHNQHRFSYLAVKFI